MYKICHMSSAHPPKDVRIFVKECKSLAKVGYEVILINQGESFKEDGVQVIGIGDISGNRIKRIFNTTRNVYTLALDVDADLYHIHDPELLPFGLKLKKRGKKVVFDSHEFYREQIKHKKYLGKFLAKIVSIIYGFYEDYVLKKIDGVIFPCTKQGKHPFQGKCKNIAIVNNTPILDELYNKYNPLIKKEEKTLCYIGTLSHGRGVTNAVKVAYETDSILVLGGVFHSKEYEMQIRKMKEFSHVKYLGKLDRKQVLDTLQKSVIGMANLLNVGQYNQYDNLPTKVYEYMSLGIPVILTRSSYNKSIIDKYKFGLCVEADNVYDISKAVKQIFETPKLAKQMGENGRMAIKSEFNWEVDFQRLLELYKKIL